MLYEASHLRADLFEAAEKAPTRDGFGKGVVEAGESDERIVVLSADLAESTRAEWFQKRFPERFIEMGVAEQNMATVAAGMAAYGKIPFFTSYATFSPGRNWEQIRTTIALNNLHAIVCGMHAGVSVGPDGATHQMLEDIALMRALPNMTVLSPCDAEEARKATLAAAQLKGPVYIRFAREKTSLMTTTDTPFEIGKAITLWNSDAPQVLFVATGPLAHAALLAARQLESEGVQSVVLNVHTIKPFDVESLLREVERCGAVVTIEEHQVAGGLGGLVAEVLALHRPTPAEFIGVQDQFGQSGEPSQLLEHYGMGVGTIVEKAKKVISRK